MTITRTDWRINGDLGAALGDDVNKEECWVGSAPFALTQSATK
jgi:hypothetical protein